MKPEIDLVNGFTGYVAGIDIGSLTAKAVIVRITENGEDNYGAGKRAGGSKVNILGYSLIRTGSNPRRSAELVLAKALKQVGLAGLGYVDYIVATGYGRISIDMAHKRVTEISCHARGARYLVQDVLTIIDIGGQDSKVIRLDETGRVVDFVMNDKCAAGTGRFLEVMADALETPLKEMGEISLKAKGRLHISSTCTVFAESEVVSLIAAGEPREEIIRGLHEAVASRVESMVYRVGLAEPVVMTGGVSRNRGVVDCLQKRLKIRITVPPQSQFAGALGAALIAAEKRAQPRDAN